MWFSTLGGESRVYLLVGLAISFWLGFFFQGDHLSMNVWIDLLALSI